MAHQDISEFKLIVTGFPGCGKRSWLQLFHEAQSGVEIAPGEELQPFGVCVYPITFQTNMGPIRFKCWVPSQSELDNGFYEDDEKMRQAMTLPDTFYLNGNAAVIFFDVTVRMSYKQTPNYFRDIVRVCDDVPVVLIGNKNDAFTERKIKPKMITFHRKKNLHYVDMSTRTQHNVLLPFLHIIRKLSCIPDLEFSSKPVMVSPEIDKETDEQMKKDYEDLERDLFCTQALALPDDDEDF